MNADPLAAYEFALPEERIAQRPAERRRDARLLCWMADGSFVHRHVAELGELIRPGDLIVLNDSRVLPARLLARADTGGRVEVLLLHSAGEGSGWWSLAKPGRKLQPGAEFTAEGGVRLRVLETADEGLRRIERVDGGSLEALAEESGHMPLPPYIKRPDEPGDRERYQTVYARHTGSAAAPTAGLHIGEGLLADFEERGARIATVTLHVGLDTFRPLDEERLAHGRLHGERYLIPGDTLRALSEARARNRRIIAWGSTSCRVLESLPDELPDAAGGETTLFIRPGHRFRWVDVLVTNFHLPRSSLLMMVHAFAGDRWRAAYECALENEYRFFSYGDANWIEAMP